MKIVRRIVSMGLLFLFGLTILGGLVSAFSGETRFGELISALLFGLVVLALPAFFILPRNDRRFLPGPLKLKERRDLESLKENKTNFVSKKTKGRLVVHQIGGLYKLALDILDDLVVTVEEAEQLQLWFQQNPEGKTDYRTSMLWVELDAALSDGVFDPDEELEIFTLLTEFCDQVDAIKEMKKEARGAKSQVPQRKPEAFTVTFDKLKAGRTYLMVYKDTHGKISEREIIFRQITRKNDREYVTAVCIQKSAVRTFRSDRITKLVDLETGEFVVG